jgi:transposase-like protein
MASLSQYSTEDRIQIVREHIGGLTANGIKKKYGVANRTLSRWKRQYKHLAILEDGFLPDQHFVKKTTVQYNKEGKIERQWLKSDTEATDIAEKLERLAKGLIKEIKPVKAKPYKGKKIKDLCCNYIISDYHLGQYSSQSETGEPWDLEMAHDTICAWINQAVRSSPRAKQALLVDLGDFLHADGLLPLTPASKHVLDASGRFHEVIDVAISCFDFMIRRLLRHHESVHVIICEGNHNESSSHWMTRCIARKYENEPRITFDMSDIPYYAYGWGNVSLFYHHGHKRRMGNVSETIVGMFRDLYGSTKYSYIHTGHLHHIDRKENNMAIVEQHSTLAAKDAHSARGGHGSTRGANVITYHKDHGEVARSVIRPEMLL